MRALRVMTYNIHSGRGLDGRVDLGRIAAVIAPFDPDIVALQEVDAGRARSGRVDQAAELATRLSLDALFAPTIEHGDERYGIATLTRLARRRTHQILLPAQSHRRAEPRCAQITLLTWDGGELEMINTHLSVLFRERRAQTEMIARSMTSEAVIVAGDFNCTPWSPAYRQLCPRLHSAAGLTRTWPSPAPIAPIDHILFRGPLRVVTASAWRGGPARIASDHLPVVAELEFDS